MEYVNELEQSTVSFNILSRWQGPPIKTYRPAGRHATTTIDERLQKLIVLCNDISERWEGPDTLEEMRFQREKD